MHQAQQDAAIAPKNDAPASSQRPPSEAPGGRGGVLALGDVPAPAREVLALFSGPLEGVRFPDVDADALGAMAQEVATRAEAVEEAREALQRARARLEESQRGILAATDKGLAYAQVFAGGQGDLAERVEALLAARAPAKPARRGRRRKRAATSEAARAGGKSRAAAAKAEVTELPLAGVA